MYMHCHALTICQLPSCNLFTQHVSYLLWRDTTSELWTPVHSFTLIKQPQNCKLFLFHSLQVNIIFHTIRLILCFQQAGEIDNLTVSLGQSILIVLCAGSTSAPDSLVLRRIIFRRWQPSEVPLLLLVRLNLGFILRENLLLDYIIPSSWGVPTEISSNFSSAVAGETAGFCKGSFTLPISLLCFCLA